MMSREFHDDEDVIGTYRPQLDEFGVLIAREPTDSWT
jgi:hypothetical protein